MAKPDASKDSGDEVEGVKSDKVRFCGIVRPIADMADYTAKHWYEVHSVVAEAVEPLGFTLRLVSESDTSGVILTEIVTNLYQDEIVIVDVSGRNPNVMFELGMRLAFEKPAIIIMDDETPFSFDISPVRHIIYPRTLRYADIVKFKQEVASGVESTLSAGPEKRNYLKQFGPIQVTQLGHQSIELNVVAQDVQETRRLLQMMLKRQDAIDGGAHLDNLTRKNAIDGKFYPNSVLEVGLSELVLPKVRDSIKKLNGVVDVEDTPNGLRVHLRTTHSRQLAELHNQIQALIHIHR